jgi:acetolactate synthase-1/2/3 large subunit
MRAGVAAVKVLQERGVRYAFGVPGESFLGLLDALYETPAIQLVATRHEGGAAFMADAVGKLTGQPAICMGTRGVGSANLAIGVHTAQQDSTPLIAMIGQVETPYRHREALQEVELAQFFGPITKWAVEAPNGAELPRIASEAYRRAISGRPGPVAIALRGDILDEEASNELPKATVEPQSLPTPEAIDAVIGLLGQAEAPLIIAGGGINRSGATAVLVRFAELAGIPVLSAFRRLDAFPLDHNLALGSLSFGMAAEMRTRAKTADVVLAIGTRLAELTTLGYSIPSPNARLIQIDVAADDLGKSFPATVAILADAKLALMALIERAEKISWPDRTAANRADRRRYLAGATPPSEPATEQLVDPARVIAELARQLPAAAIVTSDAGNFFGWVARYYPFRKPNTFLGPTSGAMGYAVPAAVAAAIVTKNAVPVIATAGDGGFMMTSNELATAAQLGLRIVNVVFNNGIYGTIRLHQEREYPGRVSGTTIMSPDFVHYAKAFGGLGVRVERNLDVGDAVRTVLAHDGISILDVAVSPDTIAVGQFLSAINKGER